MPAARQANVAVAGLAVVFAVAACGAGPADPITPITTSPHAASPSPRPSQKASEDGAAQPPAALTGLPAASAADAGKPAVVLVVAGSDPQGLGSADVVFEEITSPMVRYIAVFQSRQASAVGPITSTRPADGQAVSVLHPLIGYDGGTASFIQTLDHTKVTDVGYAKYPSLYTSTVSGLTASTETMLKAVRGSGPPALFRYRGQGPAAAETTLASTGVSRPSSVRLDIPGAGTQTWDFHSRADRWVLTGGGPRVEVANLVVQTVSYKQVYLSRHYDQTAPSARVIGSGQAEVFSGSERGGRGGTAAKGTWSKPDLGDVTNYFDSGGFPMAFLPGPTWVLLAPQGTQVHPAG